MYDNNDLNRETFGEKGATPPYTPPNQTYVTYVPYGLTPETFEERQLLKKTANLIGAAFLILTAVAAIISVFAALFLSVFGFSGENLYNILNDAAVNQYFEIVLSSLIFTLPFILLFKAGGFRISDLASYKKPKKENALPLFLFGISFCAFANMAVFFAGSIFENLGINYEVDHGENPSGFFGFLLSVIAIAIVPPLVEEFACRGLIMGSLRKFGDGFAIVVSAVLFGLMHGNFEQMPFAFLVGLVLGFITVKSGSLWIAVAVHSFNNLISVVFDYLPDSIPDMVLNVAYMILLTVIMLLGIVAFFLLRKDDEVYSLEKSETKATTKQKTKWFFSSATIVIFIIVSLLEALTFFV